MRINLSALSAACALQLADVQAIGRLWGDLRPTSFAKGDVVDVHVGQLWSAVVGSIPMYYYSLPWCDSTEGHQYDSKFMDVKKVIPKNGKVNDYGVNDWIHESPYQYTIGENQDVIIACHRILDLEEKRHFR